MAEAPKTVGRYEIVELIGKGAMGVVYKARDPNIDRIVAIKTIKTADIVDSPEGEELIQRFKREVQTAGILTHSNIVTIYDGGQDADLHWIAMEYVDGPSLNKLISERVVIPLHDLLAIFVKICSAMDFAHKKGIIHRDLKPANVILTQEWEPKIADFGIARVASSTMTRTGVILGTPSYMSPEQITGQKVDSRSDIFSLGIILYELITGERPFLGDNPTTIMYRIVHSDPLPPTTVNLTLPKGLSETVMKALKKNPGDRYHSAGAFARELITLVKSSPELSVATSRLDMPTAALSSSEISRSFDQYQPIEAPSVSRRRSPAFFGIIALIVIVIALIGGLVVTTMLGGGGADESSAAAVTGGSGEDEAVITREVKITSDPAGAAVFIDGGQLEGITPITATLQIPKDKEFSIRLEKDCLGASESLVMGEELPEELPTYTLAQMKQKIKITSDPEGATVTVDGKEIGKTPIGDYEVACGSTSQLKITMDGYDAFSQSLSWDSIGSGEPVSVKLTKKTAVQPEVKTGKVTFRSLYPLTIRSRGRRLKAEVQKRELKQIPLMLQQKGIADYRTTVELPVGRQRLDLENREMFFKNSNYSINVEEGDNMPNPLPRLGVVHVLARPPAGCVVSIDGKQVGSVPQHVVIAAGEHTFTFAWNGETKTIKETVRPLQQTRQGGRPAQGLQRVIGIKNN